MSLAFRFTRCAAIASCSTLLAGCAGSRDVAAPEPEPAALVPASATMPADANQPPQNIRDEHALTRRMAIAAEEEAELVTSGFLRRGRIEKMLDFFVNFTDRCHHTKEERYLFPMIRETDPGLRAELALLEREHAENKRRLMQMQELVDEPLLGDTERAQLGTRLREYARSIRRHIDREDRLYARIERRLSAEQNARLGRGFEQVEHDDLEEGFHEKYRQLAVSIIEER